MNFDNVHNYYETLVFQKTIELLHEHQADFDEELLEDIACITLNNLPPRYVKNEVDVAYFLTAEERVAIDKQIEQAVKHAIKFVVSKRDQAS